MVHALTYRTTLEKFLSLRASNLLSPNCSCILIWISYFLMFSHGQKHLTHFLKNERYPINVCDWKFTFISINNIYIKTPGKNDTICILHKSEMMTHSLSGTVVLKGKYYRQRFFSLLKYNWPTYCVSSRYTTKWLSISTLYKMITTIDKRLKWQFIQMKLGGVRRKELNSKVFTTLHY